MSTTTAGALPKVRTIGFDAPFRWLSGALADFAKAPLPCLGYGVAVSLLAKDGARPSTSVVDRLLVAELGLSDDQPWPPPHPTPGIQPLPPGMPPGPALTPPEPQAVPH